MNKKIIELDKKLRLIIEKEFDSDLKPAEIIGVLETLKLNFHHAVLEEGKERAIKERIIKQYDDNEMNKWH